MNKKVLSKEEFIEKYGSGYQVRCNTVEDSCKLVRIMAEQGIRPISSSAPSRQGFYAFEAKRNWNPLNMLTTIDYEGEDIVEEENKAKEVQEKKLTQGEKVDKLNNITQDEIVEEEIRKSLREHIVAGRYVELTDGRKGFVLEGGKILATMRGFINLDYMVEKLMVKSIIETDETYSLNEGEKLFKVNGMKTWSLKEVKNEIVERLKEEYKENELTGYERVEKGEEYYFNTVKSYQEAEKEEGVSFDDEIYNKGNYYSKLSVCGKESNLIDRYRVLKRDSVLNSKGYHKWQLVCGLEDMKCEWGEDSHLTHWCNLFIDMLPQQK